MLGPKEVCGAEIDPGWASEKPSSADIRKGLISAIKNNGSEVLKYNSGFKDRDPASNALYQSVVDCPHIQKEFQKAFQLACMGNKTRAGKSIAKFIKKSASHYAEIMSKAEVDVRFEGKP